MSEDDKKPMMINDLAIMVAKGFENTSTKEDVAQINKRIDKVEERMGKLEHKVEALNSNVNNYLELSEKRYSELKQRDALLAKWLKLIADKTGVPIDVSQLEKI